MPDDPYQRPRGHQVIGMEEEEEEIHLMNDTNAVTPRSRKGDSPGASGEARPEVDLASPTNADKPFTLEEVARTFRRLSALRDKDSYPNPGKRDFTRYNPPGKFRGSGKKTEENQLEPWLRSIEQYHFSMGFVTGWETLFHTLLDLRN